MPRGRFSDVLPELEGDEEIERREVPLTRRQWRMAEVFAKGTPVEWWVKEQMHRVLRDWDPSERNPRKFGRAGGGSGTKRATKELAMARWDPEVRRVFKASGWDAKGKREWLETEEKAGVAGATEALALLGGGDE